MATLTTIVEEVRLLLHDLHAGFARLEGILTLMATRAELDQVKQQLKDAIAAETAEVTAAIQALKDQLAAGTPITAQDLTDLQEDIAGVTNVLPNTP